MVKRTSAGLKWSEWARLLLLVSSIPPLYGQDGGCTSGRVITPMLAWSWSLRITGNYSHFPPSLKRRCATSDPKYIVFIAVCFTVTYHASLALIKIPFTTAHDNF